MTGSGIVTKTTLDNATTAKITSMVSSITSQVRRLSIIPLASHHMKNKMFPKAKSVVRDLDPINDLRFLRMRSNKTEILIAPGKLGNIRLRSAPQV